MARYEPIRTGDGHHHHLVCDSCGTVTPFTDDGLEDAIRKLSRRVPMRVAEHEIVLHGACEVRRRLSARASRYRPQASKVVSPQRKGGTMSRRSTVAVCLTGAALFAAGPQLAQAGKGERHGKLKVKPKDVMVTQSVRVKGMGFARRAAVTLRECGRTFWIVPEEPCNTGNEVTVPLKKRLRRLRSHIAGPCQLRPRCSRLVPNRIQHLQLRRRHPLWP